MQYLIFTATFPLEGAQLTPDQVKQMVEMFKKQFAEMGAEVDITMQSDPADAKDQATPELG